MMRQSRIPHWPLLAGVLALTTVAAASAYGQTTLTPSAERWSVRPDFGKTREARMEISGAACAKTSPPFRSCLAVNDEKKYAQFFSIRGRTIVPGDYIRLRDSDEKGNPDAEGAAYDNGYFYVTGSHGRSRNSNKDNDPSYFVFRFKVNAQTGKPEFQQSEDEAEGVDAAGTLRAAIRSAPRVGRFAEQPLKDGGVNLEGIAVKDGRMYLGFRGPSDNGEAFIMGVDAASVFSDRLGPVAVHALPLGTNVGIRDLARVETGLLVLAGPTRTEPVPYAVYHWSESGGVKKLGNLGGVPADAKAETLLVLDEGASGYRVLVMFDGIENGGPREYAVPR